MAGATSGCQLRIVTLNILNSAHSRWEERRPLIAEQLAAEDADVIALQEVDRPATMASVIAAGIEAQGGARYELYAQPNPEPSSIKSLAVLSRLPVLARTTESLEAGDIALHLRLNAGGTPLDLITTHLLYRPTREGSEIRARQAEHLLRWAATIATSPLVICGDFNSTPSGRATSVMKAALRSAHEVVHGTEPDVTHPTPLVKSFDPRLAFGLDELPEGRPETVDYIYVDAQIEVRDCRVVCNRPDPRDPLLLPSDHYGIAADLAIG